MDKKECVRCGKEFVLLTIDIVKGGLPFIHHDMYCPECRRIADARPKDTDCIECGGYLDRPGAGLCSSCLFKKISSSPDITEMLFGLNSPLLIPA